MDEAQVARVRQVAEPMLAERQMELVEFTCRPEGRRLHIRLLVDRIGGITIEQCAQVNHALGRLLEPAGMVDDSYTIEVSSPGLDRPLRTKRDFERSVGERIRVVTAEPEGRTQEVVGMVLAVQEQAVVLKIASGTVTVPLTGIRSAARVLRW